MKKVTDALTDNSAESEKLIFDPREYFTSLLVDIDQAVNELVLEAYLFKVDEIGKQFIAALSAAAHRGVKIGILVDGVGSYGEAAQIVRQLESKNCQVRIFHPLPWDFTAYRRALVSGSWYSKVLYLIASMNHRNHRKLCLIDAQIAWIGSYNITAGHLNNNLADSQDDWHDTALRVTGPMAFDLRQNFDEVWQRKSASKVRRTLKFLGNNTARARKNKNRRLFAILRGARERIWITNAYFNPSARLVKALKVAAESGVSVQILVPSHSDVLFFPAISRTYYVDLLNAGVRVFEYRTRVLHSKTMLIDNLVLVGSTNLNYRSFFHDLELDALLTSESSVQCLHDKFRLDIQNSVEITPTHNGKYRRVQKLLGYISRFLRYWL